jgi:hypothetical protein
MEENQVRRKILKAIQSLPPVQSVEAAAVEV